jgi:hypothetical protein
LILLCASDWYDEMELVCGFVIVESKLGWYMFIFSQYIFLELYDL